MNETKVSRLGASPGSNDSYLGGTQRELAPKPLTGLGQVISAEIRRAIRGLA